MVLLICTALFVMLLALSVLFWQYNRLGTRLREMEQTLASLRAEKAAFPEDFRRLLAAGQSEVISIRLLNPMELAKRQSRLAGVFGTLTPSLIKRIVHNEAIKITRKELEKHGAKAEVRFHGVG
jgi:septal ring factor EnvC (AmiA/AmiB activator)